MKTVGRWAFLGGLALTVVAGILTPSSWMFWGIAALGVLVGAINVTGDEADSFLLAATAFLVSTSAVLLIGWPAEVAAVPVIGPIATRVIVRVGTFVSAALIVVSIRTLFHIAKD